MHATPKGWHTPGDGALEPGRAAIIRALHTLDAPLILVDGPQGPSVAHGGTTTLGGPRTPGALPLLAWVPALTPDALGDASFREDYGVRVCYAAGAMANGIGSTAIVIALARAGAMGFFGAAGLTTARIAAAVDEIQGAVGGLPYGVNLIHSPQEPRQEQESVDLFIARGVPAISASAFMRLTPQVVQLRVAGVRRMPDGTVCPARRVLAKVSREEVAAQFLAPPPAGMLAKLVREGRLTDEEARLAARLPMADDLTAEADSGGHTDNRPANVLLPLLGALRDRVCAERGYARPVRIGAAGGLGTPDAVAGAFAMGAAYVLTGTVNQACVEAGTSPMARAMLAEAAMHDVGMAPASDMFEAGVKVQVLKRGTLFAMRGGRLYELYRAWPSWEAIPADERETVERTILRRPFGEVWAECESFFAERDPEQLAKASADPKHKLALVFRWYLGLSSRWAIAGDESRRTDAQVWCGPAIGAFNAWTRDTWLAEPDNRTVAAVAANLMAGAAAWTRAGWLRAQGIDVGPDAGRWTPRPLA